MHAYASSGCASQVFSIPGNYLVSGSTTLVSLGRRCQISYDMRGQGDLYAGVRVVWLNVSGEILEYKIKEDYPTGFYTRKRLVDFIPNGAVSGRIDVGIFTPCASASAFFDNIAVYLGEKEFKVNEVIDKPKTISLPEIVRSGRFSFVFAQRNPRREVLAKEGASTTFTPIEDNYYLDSTIQKATVNQLDRLVNTGPGVALFAYRVGLKELDLRYREHIPRGSIVSLPLFTRKEIRELWLTAELGKHFNDGCKFYIYPFADNTELRTEITPYIVGDVDLATSNLISKGEVLKFYTLEEQASGWPIGQDKTYIVNPQRKVEMFDGTTSVGKVRLQYAPHLKRTVLADIRSWQDGHSIWPMPFDPNLETIYGLSTADQGTIDAIRAGTASGFDLDDLISREGYLPIKVTVSTDKWIAVPDTYGRPDVTRVRNVTLEELTETTAVETTTETKEDYISFDSFMATTTAATYRSLVRVGTAWGGSLENRLNASLLNSANNNKSLIEIVNQLAGNSESSKKNLTDYFKRSYDRLKNSNKLPKDSTKTHTITNAIEINDVYSTRFKPIITGPKGSFLKLYWFDPTSLLYATIPQTSYEIVQPEVGLIRVLSTPPTTGYTKVLADYKYISYSDVEDHFGSILSFAAPTTGVCGLVGNVSVSSRPSIVTRNMTDYEAGKVPELKTPNFDRLSKEFYPVIEYYVNTDGELIFARDFFKFGEMPAQISVEYDTLAIQPRLAVEVTRSGSPAVSPTIYNVSMRTRESSPLPIREVD